MHRHRLALGQVLITLVLAAACGGGETPALTPTATPDPEAAYVGKLREITEQGRQSGQRFEDLMGPIFPRFAPDEMQALVLFNALEGAKISDTVAESLRMLEELHAPKRFEEDHTAHVNAARKWVTIASDVDEAIRRKDLPHVHLGMSELRVARNVFLAAVSPEYCEYVAPDLGPMSSGSPPPTGGTSPPPPICSHEQVPGGEYGATVNRLARTFVAEFGPRADFPPGMTPKELLEGLTYVQPAIVELFERTLTELDGLEPPPEYEVGHQVLHDYFDELLSTARAIDRAVADKDYGRVTREFERSGEVTRAAAERMPESYRPLVNVLFQPTEGDD